jgi:GAF domain-containing protein
MLLGDQVVGVISVQAYRPNAYGEAEQELLSTIADAVAMAIDNAQLYEAEQRRAARLAALQRLGTELAALREEEAVLRTLVTRTAALAESPACTVMLVDETTNEAVLAAQTGLPEDTPLDLRVPLTLPIIHRSLETGEPIILPDIDRDAPEMRTVLVRKDVRAFFAYPMMREGRAVGWITLSSLTPRTPSAQEIAAYQLLAERAAVALESARLYQEQQVRLRALSLEEGVAIGASIFGHLLLAAKQKTA